MDKDKITQLKEILIKSERDPISTKNEAKEFLKNINQTDLMMAEQELINDGIAPTMMRHLCAAHLEVINDSLDGSFEALPANHPIKTLFAEHEEILKFLDHLEDLKSKIQKNNLTPQEIKDLEGVIHHLLAAAKHHDREEKVLFIEMEKKGFFGPTQIMREEHEEMKALKKNLGEYLDNLPDHLADFVADAEKLVFMLRDHIFKENNILYPASLEIITDTEIWAKIKQDCDAIGYCCFTPSDMENKNTSKSDTNDNEIILDLRSLPPFERHTKIFQLWESLKTNQVLKIINDHNPKPLQYQFMAEYTDQFDWQVVEDGPVDWIISIKKID